MQRMEQEQVNANEPVAYVTGLNKFDSKMVNTVLKVGTPLYTHPAKNNGGNPEELNTRQIQDARTSLESTPPFAYAVVSKECPDGMENMSLQFNEPVDAKKVIPLYTHPAKTLTDEEIRTIQDMCHLKNVGYNNFIMRFARAILRKANEK